MKLLKIFVAAILALAAALTGGCSDDDGIDNRDLDYGYVQFKLYKEASYDAVSRAQKPQLDYLYEAAKVQVSLGCNGTTVTQTLTLSASDKESAEFGLRSEKLRLLTGQYQIITFSLYNANDELIYNGMPLDDRLVVEAGGPAGPRPDGRCRTARKSALHHPQGPFGLHRDARHPCGKQTVYVRRDRFHQPHRKTGRDQRTDDLQDAAHEVLDPFRRGRRHVRLPDLVARMRHAAFAQGRQLQNDAVRNLRQEQAAAGEQQAAQEPRLRHRGQQDHRNEGRRHALRGRRVYPRLLRAV